MSINDVANWRLFSRKEIQTFLSEKRSKLEDKSEGQQKSPSSHLSIRTHLKPIDLYSYLKTRFGQPNGTNTLLFPQYSSNLVHWDYFIKAGTSEVIINGLTREVHIHVNEDVCDAEWHAFFKNMKTEFSIFGKEKSRTTKEFQKWHIFQNKYAALADICAELHGDIKEEIAKEFSIKPIPSGGISEEEIQNRLGPAGKRANLIYGKCTQLRLLMPILAESYINLTVMILSSQKNRGSEQFWKQYRDTSFHDKLQKLHTFCHGFNSPLDLTTSACKQFMRIRSGRNDDIHGNHMPETNFVERVYFDNNIPLYEIPGDVMQMFWNSMEELINPSKAIEDYESILMFLIEIRNSLKSDLHPEFDMMIDEAYPGYDMNRKILGKLFPEHIPYFMFEGVRFDDELIQPV